MRRSVVAAATTALLSVVGVAGLSNATPIEIPAIGPGRPRPVTVVDIVGLRKVDTLSVSSDGRRFAIFIRQGDPVANDYRTGWFVGDVSTGALIFVGDGGTVGPETGHRADGEISGGESRWSPDGRWIAYVLKRDGEVQLWRSRTDGGGQEQVTRHAADVRDFAWTNDGRALYFTARTARSELIARAQAAARRGYRYDSELNLFTDAMKWPPPLPVEDDPSVWLVTVDDSHEVRADEQERLAFERARLADEPDSAMPPMVGAALKGAGRILKVWQSRHGGRIFFWRREGIRGAKHAFYSLQPKSGRMTAIFHAADDDLQDCALAVDDVLVCVRETKSRPAHVARIDLKTGVLKVLSDVNPEFRNIRLGRVERFEWDTPKFSWNEPGGVLAGLIEKRAYGYILYPPDFDPGKKYPVFIAPYVAAGFNTFDPEHAQHVYAANGFIVVNMAYPSLDRDVAARLGASLEKKLYSAELDFPWLTMLMESTLRGLDAASARGFIDPHRVSIGGVSHGTFVSLYLLQKHDRIAAISISSPHWGAFQYYWPTRRMRMDMAASYGNQGYDDWIIKPEGEGREFWSRIDIADHVDQIEAPVLMNLADQETYALLRLIRNMEDAGKPYDAYIFPNETHVKWQPAHLQAIMNRNLDWFRFWLQDYEDPSPSKAEQYARWRELRELQCHSARSLRNYCTEMTRGTHRTKPKVIGGGQPITCSSTPI